MVEQLTHRVFFLQLSGIERLEDRSEQLASRRPVTQRNTTCDTMCDHKCGAWCGAWCGTHIRSEACERQGHTSAYSDSLPRGASHSTARSRGEAPRGRQTAEDDRRSATDALSPNLAKLREIFLHLTAFWRNTVRGKRSAEYFLHDLQRGRRFSAAVSRIVPLCLAMPSSELPRCPVMRSAEPTDEHLVRNLSGAGGARRTYKCSCGHVWSQERPEDLDGQMPDIKPSHRAQVHGGPKRSRDGLGYRCGKCGQLKIGHVCGAAGTPEAREENEMECEQLETQQEAPDAARPMLEVPHQDAADDMRLRPPRPTPGIRGQIRIGRGHQAVIPEWPHGHDDVVRQDSVDERREGDAASAVAAMTTWPPTDEVYLRLLRMYDLRPSQLDALGTSRTHRTGPDIADDTQIVHIAERDAVCKAARAYQANAVFEKKHHADALTHPVEAAALLMVVPVAAQPPYTTARAILLYTRSRRGAVEVVHTRTEWTRRGYALRLARAVQEQVPARGSLTVDSPGCTARAAVSLWLRANFMGDEELLKCELADDAAYMGARSVRLGFAWQRDTTPDDERARLQFLQRVARKHPDLAHVCTSASVPRV